MNIKLSLMFALFFSSCFHKRRRCKCSQDDQRCQKHEALDNILPVFSVKWRMISRGDTPASLQDRNIKWIPIYREGLQFDCILPASDCVIGINKQTKGLRWTTEDVDIENLNELGSGWLYECSRCCKQ